HVSIDPQVHCELTPLKDFYREFHYAYRLSPHPNILKAYSVAFRAPQEQCLVFATEVAPLGDLMGLVRPGGLPESHVKRIAQQVASALHFMHTSGLVHRDVKPENILVWSSDCSLVKLCDFGCTRVIGELATRPRGAWSTGLPPELSDAVRNERVASKPAADCWALAVSLIVCLTGSPPWRAPAAIADPSYRAFRRWQKRRTAQVPHAFKRFTPRLLRMLKRMLEPHPEKRPAVTEVNKYLKDSWFLEGSKGPSPSSSAHAIFAGTPSTGPFGRATPGPGPVACLGGLGACPQCPPAPTSGPGDRPDPAKGRLRHILSSYGLETTVDQGTATRRIWDWVQSCELPPHDNSDGI
ncbi:serine/threonine-protein kinase meng-po, partial [Frankliniella occidentalis]|uniref:Serine/threonine-protein kinase meng-po n=1 Tax=Frankliniella occidentalis TaxID=133901 RepID=A0A9C6XW09_FRAOC